MKAKMIISSKINIIQFIELSHNYKIDVDNEEVNALGHLITLRFEVSIIWKAMVSDCHLILCVQKTGLKTHLIFHPFIPSFS